jgi:hypothetical protein
MNEIAFHVGFFGAVGALTAYALFCIVSAIIQEVIEHL